MPALTDIDATTGEVLLPGETGEAPKSVWQKRIPRAPPLRKIYQSIGASFMMTS